MGGMDEYDGSPELDVDLELLSVYEKRLERAIRCAPAPLCTFWRRSQSTRSALSAPSGALLRPLSCCQSLRHALSAPSGALLCPSARSPVAHSLRSPTVSGCQTLPVPRQWHAG